MLTNQVKYFLLLAESTEWELDRMLLTYIEFLENQIGVFEKHLSGLWPRKQIYTRVKGFLNLMQSMFERAFSK